MYAGTDHAIYKSIDSWVALSAAGSASVNALWVDPGTPSVIHAATNQGMLRSVDAGVTWQAAASGRGNVLALAAHQARPATLFAAMNLTGVPNRPSLYRTMDSGATWTLLSNSPFGPFALAVDAANPDVVYAAVSSTTRACGPPMGAPCEILMAVPSSRQNMAIVSR